MEYKSYYNKRNYLQICTYNGNFEKNKKWS